MCILHALCPHHITYPQLHWWLECMLVLSLIGCQCTMDNYYTHAPYSLMHGKFYTKHLLDHSITIQDKRQPALKLIIINIIIVIIIILLLLCYKLRSRSSSFRPVTVLMSVLSWVPSAAVDEFFVGCCRLCFCSSLVEASIDLLLFSSGAVDSASPMIAKNKLNDIRIISSMHMHIL